MQHVCEACQFGKQVRLPFENESVSDVKIGLTTTNKQIEMKVMKQQEKQGLGT